MKVDFGVFCPHEVKGNVSVGLVDLVLQEDRKEIESSVDINLLSKLRGIQIYVHATYVLHLLVVGVSKVIRWELNWSDVVYVGQEIQLSASDVICLLTTQTVVLSVDISELVCNGGIQANFFTIVKSNRNCKDNEVVEVLACIIRINQVSDEGLC